MVPELPIEVSIRRNVKGKVLAAKDRVLTVLDGVG